MSETTKKFDELQAESRDVFIRKNADYGDSFKEDGILGVMIRAKDKLNRLIALARIGGEGMLVEESVRETLLDHSNYSLMAIIAFEENGQEVLVPVCKCPGVHSQECRAKLLEGGGSHEGL